MVNRNPYLRQNLRIAPIQKLTLTPALLQKIELLTLPHLELSEFIQEELLKNPLLEELPESGSTTQGFETAPNRLSADEIPVQQAPDSFEEVDFGSFFQEYLDPGFRTTETEDSEKPGFETYAVKAPSLADHLLWQLNLTEAPERIRQACEELIGNLDDGGYLTTLIPELGASLAQTRPENSFTEKELEEALVVLQELDPPGVGARSLPECLILQLRAQGEEESLATRILERHAHLLEAQDIRGIAAAESCTEEEIQAALAQIRRLNPHPGLQYQPDSTIYIQPDVYIHKVGHEYVISLNDDGLPRLRISPFYKHMLEQGESRGEEKKFLRDHLRSAVELIRNLDHRKRTIYRVCKIIVERQADFLDNGIDKLKPMLLKDVAEELGLHTSTISRTVTNKWVHCPQGTLELRQFFTLGFKTGSGEDMSVHILKNKIRDLITQEDKNSPLSDDELTRILNRDSIDIKRRTVAKYREEMEIPNSRERKVKT